jgi:hypothetical protein
MVHQVIFIRLDELRTASAEAQKIKRNGVAIMLGKYAIEPMEPAFALASQKGLRLGSQVETRAAWRHLSALLVRNPLDLRSHAQRAYLALDSEDPELAFGALVDLFIALGNKGRQLRSALLELSRSHLASEHYLYLEAHLDHGLNPNIALPAPQGSLLDRGLAAIGETTRGGHGIAA